MSTHRTMFFSHALSLFVALGLASLAIGGCKKEEPSRWEAAAKSAEAKKEAPTADAPKPKVAEGGTLNKFFPSDPVEGKKRVFTDEKDGFVQAKLGDGKDAVTLSVNDFNGKPDEIAKFDKSTEKLGEYPLLEPTKKQTSVLVGKRYQVKVSGDAIASEERKALLQKFDLKGLAAFSPPAK